VACPKLKGRSRHGSWAFAVDLPSVDGGRKPHCRSGFPTRTAAHAALERALICERAGLYGDEDLFLTAYLTEWLRTKEETLKPTSVTRTQPAGLPMSADPLVNTVGTTGFEPATP
jgi:hypothetical protein